MNGSRWRWNPRLRVRSQRRAGREVAVLHDPDADAYYELGADEFAIARSFGAGRDLDSVRAARIAAGDGIDAGDLATFAAQLGEARILVPAEAHQQPLDPGAPVCGGGRRRWLAGGPLHLQVANLQAERFFAGGVRWLRPLLGARAIGLGVAAVLAAVLTSCGNAGSLRDSIAATLAGVHLAAVWLVYAAVVVAHELAHGFACAHLGGRVGSLGLLLLYGKPCASCDVSDAWMLGKRDRLWIMAAGSLVELGLWAVATVLWRLSAPETWVHQGAVVVLTVCGIGTLFNFNPLLRFDGYYMLSDGLEIPNLRQRAFADLTARLLGRPRPAATPRERRVFLWYGVLALVYSAAVLGFLLARAHTWVGARWGGWGTLALWGILASVSVKPLGRMLHDLAAALRAAPRARRAVFWGGAAALVAALAFVRWPLKVASECRIEPRARVVVRSPLAGTVESVPAREGDGVAADQPLVVLGTRDLDFALAAAEAEVRELEAKLALLESGPRRQEIDMAARHADAAATRVEYARRALERGRAGLRGDVVSREAVDAAERESRLAEDEERTAQEALDLLRAGARQEELQAMRARLEAVRAEVERLLDERRRTRIVAPFGGQVLTPRAERLVGRYVERGDSLLVLADTATMVVEIPISEKDVADVAVGAAVRFKARSLPQRIFAGRVVGIAAAAERGARQHTVLVRSEIDNPAGLLRPGTTGFAKIYCGDRPLGAILARRGVRMLRTEFWALW